MPLINIILNFDYINVSAQVGDIVYYSDGGTSIGGFNSTALSNTHLLGEIVSISGSNIIVQYDDAIATPPAVGAYISFAKDKRVNTTSLVGYYANVNFVNNSTKKVELFSVGSEISESSK